LIDLGLDFLYIEASEEIACFDECAGGGGVFEDSTADFGFDDGALFGADGADDFLGGDVGLPGGGLGFDRGARKFDGGIMRSIMFAAGGEEQERE
jgi:hypothetical protein